MVSLKPGIKQRLNDGTESEYGGRMVDFFTQNKLRINITCFNHKIQHMHTFENT